MIDCNLQKLRGGGLICFDRVRPNGAKKCTAPSKKNLPFKGITEKRGAEYLHII